MKVAFCARRDLFDIKGGDTIQLLQTKVKLEEMFQIEAFIVTDPNDLDNTFDIAHIFNLATMETTKAFFGKARSLGLKIALSTIYWDYSYACTNDIALRIGYSISASEAKMEASRLFCKLTSAIIKRPWVISEPFREYIREHVAAANVLLPNSMEEMELLASFAGIPSHDVASRTQVVVNAATFADDHAYDGLDELALPEKYILQIGRIQYAKNQINVVKALEGAPDIPIVFIGQILERSYYEAIKKIADKRGNVHFIEEIDHRKIPFVFRNALLHILPSLRESPGLVSLEALGNGCRAVVADSRFAPVDSYFKGIATVVNPLSLSSIRAGIKDELNTSRDMKAISHLVRKKFTWEEAARQTREGYSKALEHNIS